MSRPDKALKPVVSANASRAQASTWMPIFFQDSLKLMGETFTGVYERAIGSEKKAETPLPIRTQGVFRFAAPIIALGTFASLWAGADAAAPTVINPIPDQVATLGAPFSYGFNWNHVFSDLDGDTLSISATLSNGTALPGWLNVKMYDYSYLINAYEKPPGNRLSITSTDGIAYATNGGAGLLTFNITEPSNPVFLDRYDTGYADGVAVEGGIAYVVNVGASGLQILDVRDPRNITFLGRYIDGSGMGSIAVKNALAYIGSSVYGASGFRGLQIFNVSNPQSPLLVGRYNTTEHIPDLTVIGDKAYLANDLEGVLILDISDPSSPTNLSHTAAGRASAITVEGGMAYLSRQYFDNFLAILNISNPTAPEVLSTYRPPYTTTGSGASPGVIGGTVYALKSGSTGLEAINISDPLNPIFLASYDVLELGSGDLSMAGDVAYMFGTSGLKLINTKQHPPTAQYPLGIEQAYLGYSDSLGYCRDIVRRGNIAYVVSGSNGFNIIDVSNTTTPNLLHNHPIIGGATGLYVRDNVAYVAGIAGLQILNISDPTNTYPVGNYTTPGAGAAVTVVGDTAYFADGLGGLQLLDISDLSNPLYLGSYSGGDIQDVVVDDNIAYIADATVGLKLINVSNPAAATFLGGVSSGSYSIAKRGDVVFTGRSGLVLRIVNVSNPTSPFVISEHTISGVAHHIQVIGNTLYVPANGLYIFDISNLLSPTLIGHFNTPVSDVASVSIVGGKAYLAARRDGLRIIDISRRTFYGTPTQEETLTINVTAQDEAGNQVTNQFKITARNQPAPTPTTRETPIPETSSSSNTDNLLWLWIVLAAAGISGVTLVGFLVYKHNQAHRQRNLPSSKSVTFFESGEDGSDSDIATEMHAAIATPPAEEIRASLSPTRTERHTIIGGKYALINKISRKEAVNLFEQTNTEINFPGDKNKIKVTLGEGNFGKLRLARRLTDSAYVAVKKVKGDNEIQASKDEGALQSQCDNEPNVMPVLDFVESTGSDDKPVLYQFMPLAGFGNGDELKKRLVASSDIEANEKILLHYAREFLTGISRLHAREIYHLDVKLANTVINSQGTTYIIDFGCAQKFPDGQITKATIGDSRYFSPERLAQTNQLMRKQQCDFIAADKVDAWAAGVALFELLIKEYPFDTCSFAEKISSWDAAYFSGKIAEHVILRTPTKGSLPYIIKGLLDPNPDKRLSITAALEQLEHGAEFANEAEQQQIFSQLKKINITSVGTPPTYATKSENPNYISHSRHLTSKATDSSRTTPSGTTSAARDALFGAHTNSGGHQTASASIRNDLEDSSDQPTIFPADYANDPGAFRQSAAHGSAAQATTLPDDYGNDPEAFFQSHST